MSGSVECHVKCYYEQILYMKYICVYIYICMYVCMYIFSCIQVIHEKCTAINLVRLVDNYLKCQTS